MIILFSFVVVIGAWIAAVVLRAMASSMSQFGTILSGGREQPRSFATPARQRPPVEAARFPAASVLPSLSDHGLSLDAVQEIWNDADAGRQDDLPSLLASEAYRRKGPTMPIVLGLTAGDDPAVIDLASAPHLLIGGTTGSGKSVLQHALVTSLIHRHGPRTLRLLLVDTKGLELTPYNGLPHLRHPVITQPSEAVRALQWVTEELTSRMALLRANQCRSISDFNEKARTGECVLLRPMRDADASEERGRTSDEAYLGDVLPYLVVIIDDLADLGAQGGAVHALLSTIAQAGRAAGVHLVCVTQRPSAAVVAGDAKALFPTRIAFRLPAAVDSRIVLDKTGAERLEGAGAMILVSGDNPEGLAVRGAMVSPAIVDLLPQAYIQEAGLQASSQVIESDILANFRKAPVASATSGSDGQRDPLFREAAELCIQNGSGSTSLLQRHLGIGYGRAARLIDQLSEAGVLDDKSGPKGREVRVDLADLAFICGAP